MPNVQPISIQVTAQTPIWTGNAERKTEYIKATSILGGLRFWTEALMRSLGAEVCNITSDGNKCPQTDNQGQVTVCPVCNFFGCTGLGRAFALRITNAADLRNGPSHVVKLDSYALPNGKTKTPQYLDGKSGKSGTFEIQIVPMKSVGIDRHLSLALLLLLKWGTIGARDQYGHGIISAILPDEITKPAEMAILSAGTTFKKVDGISLRDFFFYKGDINSIKTKNVELYKIPFLLRADVRAGLRTTITQKALRHYFGGTIEKNDKCATKFNIGIAGNQLRGWGWFPRGDNAADRNTCLNLLKHKLGDYVQGTVNWREFNSSRDIDATGNPHTDWPLFLEKLYREDWA